MALATEPHYIEIVSEDIVSTQHWGWEGGGGGTCLMCVMV